MSRPTVSKEGFTLFLLGFLTLFLELFFIRYLAGSIWNLGYFPNSVLMSAFIGMGIGFVFHQRVADAYSAAVFQAAFVGIVGLIVFVAYAHPVVPGFELGNGNLGGDFYFSSIHEQSSAFNSLFFVLCLATVALIFGLISQRTAKVFRQFPPLSAYSFDILGSCAGIAAFIAISALELPAWSWFLFFTCIFMCAMPGPWRQRWLPPGLAVVAVIVMLGQDHHPLFSGTGRLVETVWSPYQKIEYLEYPSQKGAEETMQRRVLANGLGHQAILAHPEKIHYRYPYDYRVQAHLPPTLSVLVIGAGTGNDVATALRCGATHVDAVEIDPAIAKLGREHNPSGVYDDPRVAMHIDDGRAFMTQTHRKYDLIVFALTDSLVKVSSLSQLRLENYLFTLESIERAYRLLNDHGNIVLYNYYRLPFVVKKIYNTLLEVTGTPPIVLNQEGDFFMLCGEKDAEAGRTSLAPELLFPKIPTDDWPFLYLESEEVPSLYLKAMLGVSVLIGGLLALLHFSTRNHEDDRAPGMLPVKLAFVFMGIAFLLLETKSIVQFSLLFGTTWLNNSLTFLAVLISVLAANWTIQFFKIGRFLWLFYVLLALSVLGSYVFPLHNLLGISGLFPRFLAASLLTFLPIYFANLIFSALFQHQKFPEHLFGWNLLGATFGGVLEYSSMALGYNALSLVVLGCYTAVFLLLLAAQKRMAGAAV